MSGEVYILYKVYMSGLDKDLNFKSIVAYYYTDIAKAADKWKDLGIEALDNPLDPIVTSLRKIDFENQIEKILIRSVTNKEENRSDLSENLPMKKAPDWCTKETYYELLKTLGEPM